MKYKEKMKLITCVDKFFIDTDSTFSKEVEKINSLSKLIREYSNMRYGDSVYRHGSLGNYFNIARKYERLRMRFENDKSIVLDGDSLLDTYIDLLNYSIFGILIALIEEEISVEQIDKKISILEKEILKERNKNENRNK